MNLFLFSICSLFLFESSALAQVANASIFSNMRSINPAVIGQREFGQYSLSFGMDTIEKYQLIDKVPGSHGETLTEESETEIDIDDQSFFRGGKRGGLITTELSYIRSNGDKKITLMATGLDDTVVSNSVKFTNLELAMGVGRYFGLSYSKQDFFYHSKFSFTFDDNEFEDDVKEDISGHIIKFGATMPFGTFQFAGFYESSSLTNDKEEYLVMSGYDTSSTKSKASTVGLGFGIVTKSLHIEASYEKIISADYTDNSPVRLSSTFEMKFWKLSLGYTGRLYKEGFQDNDKIVYNELVFPGDTTDSRLEHIVNFSFGSGKGFSFGGSGTFTKYTTKETNPLVSERIGELDTDIKQIAFSLEAGYVW